MAIKTGRTMSLVLGGTTVAKLTGISLSASASQLNGAVTNETTGLFPESAVSGLSANVTGNAVLDSTVFSALWTKMMAGAEIAYTMKDETTAGEPVWTGECVITGISKTTGAASETTYSVTAQLSGAPTITPLIIITPAAGALAAQVGVSATIATAQATGGNDPYTYTMVGHIPGISINASTGVINGTPSASVEGTYVIEVTATDDDGVAATNRYTVVVAAA